MTIGEGVDVDVYAQRTCKEEAMARVILADELFRELQTEFSDTEVIPEGHEKFRAVAHFRQTAAVLAQYGDDPFEGVCVA